MYRRHDDEMRDLTRRTDEMLGRIRGLREAMTIADDGSAHDAARLIRALHAAAWEEYDGLLAEQQAMCPGRFGARSRPGARSSREPRRERGLWDGPGMGMTDANERTFREFARELRQTATARPDDQRVPSGMPVAGALAGRRV